MYHQNHSQFFFNQKSTENDSNEDVMVQFRLASSSASIAHLMYKDLWFDRSSIASEMKERFKSLDSRVFNLESVLSSKANAPRDEETVG